MKRLDSLHVVQIRLFRIDEIPLSDLRLESSVQRVQQAFSFKQSLPLQPPLSADPQGAIAFMSGELKLGEKAYEVEKLIIESRRIIISVASTSATALSAFDTLKAIILKVDQREAKPAYDPVVMTEETTTVAHLDFPITSLFAGEAYNNLIAGFVSRIANYGAKTRIVPSSLHFRVTYEDLPASLKQSNISLSDKDIAIELRVNTGVEESAYFLTSPNSSDVHLGLIALLEDVFRAPKKDLG
jgi:hypothetical protein